MFGKFSALAAAVMAACAVCLPLDAALADAPAHPWETATAVVKATAADANAGGIARIQAHVADLEAALAGAPQALKAAAAGDKDVTYVLTDGPIQAGLATLAAAGDNSRVYPGHSVRAVENPYPAIGFYLGTFYNETGRPADAIRVLDAGLALDSAVKGDTLGSFQSNLISERAAALGALKRWPEVLAGYDDGLKLPGIKGASRARMERGRGAALTELGRLDEAEKAYRDSLEDGPGNARALGELQYIARLRAGGHATAVQLGLPPSAPKPQ
jgi:tetratricopeptide (TPR) repeat protein